MIKIDIKDNVNYNKIFNIHNLSFLQFIKLINNLLTDYNKKIYTSEDVVSFFCRAYDNWMHNEFVNERVESIAKPYLLALNNQVDEQILTAITNSVLANLNFTELKDEFLELFIADLKLKINDESILSLLFINIQSTYFATLIKKYKYDDFLNQIHYIINILIDDNSTRVKRPLDPAEFQNLSDEEDPINNVLTSAIRPINFVNHRNSAVVILDNIVLAKQKNHLEIINDYKQECEDYNPNGNNIFEEFNISTLAVGSIFGTAVLLEYITSHIEDNIINGKINSNNGNFEIIKQALQKRRL